MRNLIATVALIAFAATPFAAYAGQDETQRLITQRLQEQKIKLAAAEMAQGVERDKLMQEHMKMMQETIGKMEAMKPREGMTLQERTEWMADHQKLMEQMLGQMMAEHHLMMQGVPMAGTPRK